MKTHKKYIVGGYVRDKILGVESKDIDYAFEFTEDFISSKGFYTGEDFYKKMNDILIKEGFSIFLETSSCFTTRAKFPDYHEHKGRTADFVLCRREVYDNSESRIPVVYPTSLYEDQKRRDFTVNSIAYDEETKSYIDPFGGVIDLIKGVLRCPIDPYTSFKEDPLRILRAFRFHITKGFEIQDEVMNTILTNAEIWDKFDSLISVERKREELIKMFKFNTNKTLRFFNRIQSRASFEVLDSLLPSDIWLKPTNEKR